MNLLEKEFCEAIDWRLTASLAFITFSNLLQFADPLSRLNRLPVASSPTTTRLSFDLTRNTASRPLPCPNEIHRPSLPPPSRTLLHRPSRFRSLISPFLPAQ
jgi:hypothetical protein